MNIQIRPAKADDSSALEKLLSQITRIHHSVRPDLFRSDYKSKQVNWKENADEPVFVAVDEQDNVVGGLWCIVMHMRDNSLKTDRDWLCIDNLCVDEKHRRQGIGRQLAEFACRLAAEKGLNRIELNVYNDNSNSVSFYQRFGFRTQKQVMELDISAAKLAGGPTERNT